MHWGSGAGLTDYETETTLAFLNGSFYPADKWSFMLGGSIAISKGSFSPIDLELTEEAYVAGTDDTKIEHADYDFSEVNDYSDLDFTQLQVWGKGTREILDNASIYVGVGYIDLQDDQPYIYGDQSGELAYVHSGLMFVF